MVLANGTQLGPHVVVAHIGAGGMGDVYKARDTRLNRFVAIKTSREKYSERFEREMRIIASLSHPNVCALYDVGPNYLVMELLEGQTLQEAMRARRLSTGEAVRIAEQMADALDAAHAKGITHRDIKPGNVFVSPKGHVKVLDFGLAKFAAEPISEDDETQTMAAQLSQPGQAMGTVAYMSPEQARGQKLDGRSDLWSLGVVLHEMLTGARPFEGPRHAVVFNAIFTQQPKPTGASPELDRLVARLLEKDRDQRSQTAAEVQKELRDELQRIARTSATPSAMQVAAPLKTFPQFPWILVAAGLAVAVIGAGAWWSQSKPAAVPIAQSGPAPEPAKDPLQPETPLLLNSKDVTVVSEFVNKTSEPAFASLREFLTAKLQESEIILPMSQGQMSGLLEEMKRDPQSPITPKLATELCLRAGQKATLTATITEIGKQYGLVLTVTSCQNGEVLASAAGDVAGKEQVMMTLAAAVDKLRQNLGEKLAGADKPEYHSVLPVTTSSLEAFQAYTMAMGQLRLGQWEAAATDFHRAREIDPKFALAWGAEGVMLENARHSEAETEPLRAKGYELRKYVSRPERLLIEGVQYHEEGDLKKARASYEEMLRLVPRSSECMNFLANVYRQMGEYERAVKLRKLQLQVDPAGILGYTNAMQDYILLDRFQDAHIVAEMPFAKKTDPPARHEILQRLAYLEGDEAAAEREFQFVKDSVVAQNVRVSYAVSRGRFADAATEAAGNGKGPPNFNAQRALAGDCGALSSPLPPSPQALLFCSEYARGATRAEEILAQPDLAPAAQAFNRAAAALAQHQPQQAINLLAPLRKDELPGNNAQALRGFAYMELKKPTEAAVEFRKLGGRKSQLLTQTYPWAQVQLARALAQAGNTAEAKKTYEAFFSLWKNADAGLPLLETARKDYAALR